MKCDHSIAPCILSTKKESEFEIIFNKVRGVPAYTQSTQLRTLIFECPKNKNVLNREKCNKNMPHPG